MSISITSIEQDARNRGWSYGDCRLMVTASARIIRGVLTCVESGMSITGGEITIQGGYWHWDIIYPQDYFRWNYEGGEYVCLDLHYRVTLYGEGGEGDVAQQTITAFGGYTKIVPPMNLKVNGKAIWDYNRSGDYLSDSKAELTWETPIGGVATPYRVRVVCPYISHSGYLFEREYETNENSFRVPLADLRLSATRSDCYLEFSVTAANGYQSRPWTGFIFNGQGGTVAYWDGTQWVTCYANYYDGTQWKQSMPRYWNGTEWVECSR